MVAPARLFSKKTLKRGDQLPLRFVAASQPHTHGHGVHRPPANKIETTCKSFG
jgi:hypothetical protein